MNENEKLTMDLIHEVASIDVEDLDQFKSLWLAELLKAGLGENTRIFCATLCDLVKAKKDGENAPVLENKYIVPMPG